MATIYLVKDGRGEGRTSRGHNVAIENATEEFSGFAVYFRESGPVINPGTSPNPVSPYRHVVLKVEAGEENEKFPKAGFYLVAGLQPGVCARKFDISY